MRPATSRVRGARARRRLLLALAAACVAAVALVLVGVISGHGRTGSAAASSAGEPEPQTDASVPARAVTMIAATPQEPGVPGAGETWGIGGEGNEAVLVRYAQGAGWARGPALPSGFSPAPSPLTGAMTPDGAGVLAGTEPVTGGTARDVLLVRDPGGAFTETTPVPAEGAEEPLLHPGEALLGGTARAPIVAALDEAGAKTGALVAPVALGPGVERQVLHWDGTRWTSEPIAVPANSSEEFRVLALAAASPANAWLLAQLSTNAYPPGSVALFRRVEAGAGATWKPVALVPGGGDGEAHPLTATAANGEARPFTVPGTGSPPTVRAQVLTVTGEGVWVDGERGDVHGRTPDSTTLFFSPEGAAGGRITGSWCVPPPEGGERCQFELPRGLPSPYDRSFAWAGSGPYGQRVITGFPGGISLRLQGETFARVLALGGGENSEQTPGARFGAAFTNPDEGWLGASSLPVHLTTSLEPSRLTPWPVPFRHPLLAIAPQPGAPVGAPSSEALAVGDLGAVARFKPGAEGHPGHWIPEALFGPGQRVEKPRLRAVAWPTPNRAYAVGDEGKEIGEQMWLWRGETGLWEHDPAAPLNFTGNLLGIAFDPGNPTRGYAVGTKNVGQGGVLLHYGKSWAPEAALPPEVQQAAFVAIAFAGPQAIVAYRLQPNPAENHFVGGLMLNDGSGWHVDQQAAALIGDGAPVAVAGLSDGGAAFEMTAPGSGPRVFERESAGAPWRETPTRLPGVAQGSLSLFREAGALRAVVSGGGGVGNQGEAAPPAPGFPPNFRPPLSPTAGSESGGLLRQTASGWRDEGHEVNVVGPPAGGYNEEDIPYRPDSIFATLVNPEGGAGWVVGGNLNENERVETANVERYQPNPGEAPPATGVEASPVPLAGEPGVATFAFGGHAECVDPCGERAKAGVGPLVWLSAAVGLAARSNVPAFIYTGPSVTAGAVGGIRSVPIPFDEELQTTAAIIAAGPPDASFAAASPQDLDARPEREGTEAAFANAFAGFPQSQLPGADRSPEQCPTVVGCQAAYYSFVQAGTQVIVLDDTGDVNATQLGWLTTRLGEAAEQHRPAIVVGSADIAAQVNAGDGPAQRVAEAITRPVGGASAYFFDAPEEDVQKPIVFGGQSIPSFGSGTLGYVEQQNERAGNFHGASGILLGEVIRSEYATGTEAGTTRAPVRARLIPVIGELALEGKDGILLRRSQAALFSGLARRPRAGTVASTNNSEQRIDPYIPIPEICVGPCSTALLPEYSFTSSNEEVGMFAKHNTASVDPHAVLQNANGEPIFEHHAATSGLFCALNKGQTTVTITAGGLTASQLVTVQAGSVRQPCGTTPINKHPSAETSVSPAPPPPVQPAPITSAPASSPPPVPLPPPPPLAAVPPPPARQPTPAPFVPLAPPATPLLAFVPPPVPTPARPTPPSGTSAVTSPIEVAEKEEEQEEAPESVSNKAAAYRASEELPEAPFVIGFLILAAFAGASIRSSMRRRRGKPRVAPATVLTAHSQRMMSGEDRRKR